MTFRPELKEIIPNNENVRYVYHNKICCDWQKKLQSVFGQNLKVLLDLFHAVQRVLEKIPKRHKLRQPCARDFQMVFRNPADRGEDRTMATPSAGIYMLD